VPGARGGVGKLQLKIFKIKVGNKKREPSKNINKLGIDFW
jgi:hypothetical protein